MKLYLDLCVYNRPFDHQGQDRIALEAGAFIYILEKIEKGDHAIVISEALVYENNRNPDALRRHRVASYFQLAQEVIAIDSPALERVEVLKGFGFSDVDALHIALAENSNVNYFITCDDDIVHLCRKYQDSIKVSVVSLLEFIALEVK